MKRALLSAAALAAVAFVGAGAGEIGHRPASVDAPTIMPPPVLCRPLTPACKGVTIKNPDPEAEAMIAAAPVVECRPAHGWCTAIYRHPDGTQIYVGIALDRIGKQVIVDYWLRFDPKGPDSASR